MKHYIIPIFIPHYGCPNQCVFCDQHVVTGTARPVGAAEVVEIIEAHLLRIDRPRLIEVAFYGGSFTAIPAAQQTTLLAPAKLALDQGRIAGIRLSTRPDAIDGPIVERLRHYGVGIVELGAQSMDDRVLCAAGRGHNAAATVAAVAVIKAGGLQCGLQLMPGLPEEDWPSLIGTARAAASLRPDFARIYPTVVIAGTRLARMYHDGQYRPLTLEAAVARSAYLRLWLEEHGIPVIRTGLQATEDLSGANVVAGPYHPAFGEMVEAFWFRMMIARFLDDFPRGSHERLVVHHHPRDHSKLRGIRNANLDYWRREYGLTEFCPVADGLRLGEVEIEAAHSKYLINKAMLFVN